MSPSPLRCGLGPWRYSLSRPQRVHLCYGPVTRSLPWGDLVDRLQSFSFHHLCYPNYGALTSTPAGLSPAEHASLHWTHKRTEADFRAWRDQRDWTARKLAVFHRPNGGTFGGGLDVSDLRITRGFKFGYRLLLGQGTDRREDATESGQGHRRRMGAAERHRSWLCPPVDCSQSIQALNRSELERHSRSVAATRNSPDQTGIQSGSDLRKVMAGAVDQKDRLSLDNERLFLSCTFNLYLSDC